VSLPGLTRRGCLARLAAGAALAGLAGCGGMQRAEPMAARLAGGVRLQPGLPETRPGAAFPMGDRNVLWVPMHGLAHAAVSQLVPVPFLTEAVDAVADRAEARSLAWLEAALDSQAAVASQVQRNGLLAAEIAGAVPVLRVFAVAQDCIDDRVRVALVGQLDAPEGQAPPLARYVVHLPGAPLRNDFAAGPGRQRTAAALRAEMDQATIDLADLLQRARAGRLVGNGRRADVGSLHLAGSAAGGLMSPMHLTAKAVELIDDEGPVLLFRADGLPQLDVPAGGLIFGVHHLPRAALHTFKPAAA
jgi:hypothetical protein